MYETALGPNEDLILASAETFAANAVTPALCIERSVFEANLVAMQSAASTAGKGLRPHMKGHKSKMIAAKQRNAGAVGISCATGKEVEAAADAGIASILLTTPAASPLVLDRLAELTASGAEIIIAVDSVEVARRASDATAGATLGILLDLNVGQNRTGAASSDEAVAIASQIATLPGLQLLGVQAYYGHLQHIAAFADRHKAVSAQWEKLRAIIAALRAAGHAIDIVSGGGTGTAELDLASDVFTEIQPGSYPFIDSQYGAIERRAIPLGHALTVLSRVTSTAVPDQAVIDAGTKAISTDPATMRFASPRLDGVTHRFMGDEHSALTLAPGATRLAVGDLVPLIATHCDPTVNLHDRFHIMDNGRLIDIWPIEARGY